MSQMLTAIVVFFAFTYGLSSGDDKVETKVVPTVKKKESLDSHFAAGSKWKGTVRELKGKEELTTDVLVTVTKRTGTEFQGTYEIRSGDWRYLIEGTIERNQVNFKFVEIDKLPTNAKKPANLVGVWNRGTLRTDNKTMKPTITSFYTWEDSNDPSVSRKGTVVLSLFEKPKPTELK